MDTAKTGFELLLPGILEVLFLFFACFSFCEEFIKPRSESSFYGEADF